MLGRLTAKSRKLRAKKGATRSVGRGENLRRPCYPKCIVPLEPLKRKLYLRQRLKSVAPVLARGVCGQGE